MQSDKMPSGEIVSAKRPTRPQRTAPLDGGGGRAVASDPIRSMETFEIIELPEAAEAEAAGGDPDVEAPPLPSELLPGGDAEMPVDAATAVAAYDIGASLGREALEASRAARWRGAGAVETLDERACGRVARLGFNPDRAARKAAVEARRAAQVEARGRAGGSRGRSPSEASSSLSSAASRHG